MQPYFSLLLESISHVLKSICIHFTVNWALNMHDLDVTSSQITLVCHWQGKISGANLVVSCYKSPFSIFNINLHTYIKVEPRIKKASWHLAYLNQDRMKNKKIQLIGFIC